LMTSQRLNVFGRSFVGPRSRRQRSTRLPLARSPKRIASPRRLVTAPMRRPVIRSCRGHRHSGHARAFLSRPTGAALLLRLSSLFEFWGPYPKNAERRPRELDPSHSPSRLTGPRKGDSP
jgi:hypothetical protein